MAGPRFDTINPKRVLNTIKASDVKDDNFLTITETNPTGSFFQDFLIRVDALASNFSTFIESRNVGTGAGVFKQNNDGVQEFRSILAGSSNIVVTENEDDITLDVPDKFVNSVDLNGTTLRLNRSEGLTSLEVDLGPLVSAFSDGVISGGTFNIGTGILTINRTGGLSDVNIDLSDLDQTDEIANLVDQYVDSATFSSSTNVLTLGRTGTLPDLSVDLSTLATSTSPFLSSASFNSNGSILTLGRTNASNLTVDLSDLNNPGLVGGSWVLPSKRLTLLRDALNSDIIIPLTGLLGTTDINNTFTSTSTTQVPSANVIRLLHNRTNGSDLYTRNSSSVNLTLDTGVTGSRTYGPVTISGSSLGNSSSSHRIMMVGQFRFHADDNTDDSVRVRLQTSTSSSGPWTTVTQLTYQSDGSKDWIHPNIFGVGTVPAGGSLFARIQATTVVGGASVYSTSYMLQAFSINVFD